MTISELVFRSTSVLGSQGRAPWCCCSQCPAGTALTASLSCWTWPCPGCLTLTKERGSLWWQDTKMKVSVARQHSDTKLWGIPTRIESKHTKGPLESWGAPHWEFSASDRWLRSTALTSLSPQCTTLNHQEWTGLQQLRKILVQWQMQFNAGKRRIKIVRQKIPKESQDIRGKCSEAWWLKRDLSVLLGYESLKLMDNCSGKIMLHSELHA